MDKVSVITLSSSSSQASPLEGNAPSWLSVVSVRWNQELDSKNPTISPDISEKVKDWMATCEDCHPETNTTCIRYDFDKNPRAPSVPKSCFTETTSLFSYIEESKKQSTCRINLKNLVNGQNCPDTHKKELCSYLQLMKPNEKKNEKQVKRPKSTTFKTKRVFTDFTEYENVIKEVVDYPSLKSFDELDMKIDKLAAYLKFKQKPNKFLPLPPKRVYSEFTDFENSMGDIIKKTPKINGVNARKLQFKQPQRIISLRSRVRLRDKTLNNLILRTNRKRKKARKKLLDEFRDKTRENQKNRCISRCEIVSVHFNSDDENIDLQNFVDDMLELDIMSEEHRKCVIESRILASSSITNLINKQQTQEADVQRAYKIFSDLSKSSEEKENTQNEHNYARNEEQDESGTDSLSPVPISDVEVVPINKDAKVKSLHRSLTTNTRRKIYLNNYGLDNYKSNHSISISRMDGTVLRAFYQDYNLIVAQQNCVSFWTQSALGNVLGAQNMWIPKGKTQRIPLNSTYVQKNTIDMVISTETSIAYVELWTKEHKSEMREVPVADVFATVYFWRLRQNGLDKKALQLENIKGFASDVQYCVLRCYPKIVVSWRSVHGSDKRTKIHSYHLAADFQTVASISEIQQVEHYVCSLHNIEDCDNLVMGCGEDKLTLWNIDYGYIVATVQLSSVQSPMSTLWVKCDRGFLFTVQECSEQEIRLVAINGMNHSWKKLQNYNSLPGFDCLKGVCIENGILIAYYSQGILCWNAQTGELIVEEVSNECDYIPCGKYVIMIFNENIIVKHSLSHLMTGEEV